MAKPTKNTASTDHRFTAGQVCAAAGIRSTTLNTWRARRDLVIEKDTEMGWTRYDDADALRVCLLSGLLRKGLSLKLASAATAGLHEEGLLRPVLAGAQLFVAIFDVDQNVDDKRKPDGAAYQLLCAASLSKLIRVVASRSADDDWSWHFLDVAKMWRRAERVLKGAP